MADRPDPAQVMKALTQMDEVVRAPFTSDQCMSLNAYQIARFMAPFTCPRDHIIPDYMNCSDCLLTPGLISVQDGSKVICSTCGGTGRVEAPSQHEVEVRVQHVVLMALADGWHCAGEFCDYTQDWAWPWMANGEWTQLRVVFPEPVEDAAGA